MSSVAYEVLSLLEKDRKSEDFLQTLELVSLVLRDLRREKEEKQSLKLAAHASDPTAPLNIQSVDLHRHDNCRDHHTDKYASTKSRDPSIVARRGQPFKISFLFDRKVNLETDEIVLRLTVGDGPKESNNTLIDLPIKGKADATLISTLKNGWGSGLIYQKGCTISLNVLPPSNCIIGFYRMALLVKNKQSGNQQEISLATPAYILFNPWLPADDTYMKDEKLIEEYVLNDYGKLYQGTQYAQNGKKWHFGQFEEVVLPAVRYLFELGGVTPIEDLNSPVQVARHISALVDSNDEGGLVEGKWADNGDYSGGVPPIVWNSSVTILESFLRTGGATVRYGQCWVYAGVVTTLCRAVGLPCRPITNFESAHDTDGNLEIDFYMDANKNPLKSDDSVWNFHLWNEVWMRRPDLGSEYDGWQAIDGTPQFVSENRFRVGPCPVLAIKLNKIDLKYDTSFIYAETNAKFNFWQRNAKETTGFKKIPDPSRKAGVLILTKKPGVLDQDEESVKDAEDITQTYKHQKLTSHSTTDAEDANDIAFEIVPSEDAEIGKDIVITLKATNKADTQRTVNARVAAVSLSYNGAAKRIIKREDATFAMAPGETKCMQIAISVQDYAHKISEMAMIKISALTDIEETQLQWVGHKTIQLSLPKLNIEFKNTNVGKELSYIISMVNPLPIALTDCAVYLEIPTLLTPPQKIDVPDIAPLEDFKYIGRLIAKRACNVEAMATLTTHQLFAINCHKSLQIN